MGICVELDWDSVDEVTTENLYDHYRIVCAMIDDGNRVEDLEYNLKLKESLIVVLQHFGVNI